MACDTVRAILLGTLLLAVAPTAAACPQQQPPVAPEAAPVAAPEAAPDPEAVQRRLATLHDGALMDSRNGDDLMLETEGYRRLLKNVSAVDPAEMSRRATLELDLAQALKDPDALRGAYVRVRGLLAGFKAERLDRPLDGIEDVWEGVVGDSDGSGGIVFDVLTRPEDVEPQRDIVDVEGVFYRTARYENRHGVVVEAPYIVARSVVRVETAPPEAGLGRSVMIIVLIGAAVAFIVVRVLMLVRDRGRTAPGVGDPASAIRRAAAQHKREAAARAKAAQDGSSPPTGPPAKLP